MNFRIGRRAKGTKEIGRKRERRREMDRWEKKEVDRVRRVGGGKEREGEGRRDREMDR